jgi:hypothetical protein
MFGSQILDVAIGVMFVYLLVSIICTAIREGMETWMKSRATYLEHGIRELLHDQGARGIARSLYNHPLIYSLYGGQYAPGAIRDQPSIFARGRNLPSYIPSRNFALALMDIAARGPATSPSSSDATGAILSVEAIRTNVLNVGNPAVQRVLLTALDSAQGDLSRTQANIEAWFDSGMDRVSGQYKRSTQFILFVVGLLAAILLNVNTITIAGYLYKNETARATIVARSEAAVTDTAFARQGYDSARKDVDELNLPIGWAGRWKLVRPWDDGWWDTLFGLVLGWLMTAFAATLGAPFWFDLLNKMMVVRSTVKPHQKSPEEASEDHQSSTGEPAAAPQPVGSVGSPGVAATRGVSAFPSIAVPSLSSINLARGKDAESDVDGCDVAGAAAGEETLDEDLPAASGGVQ